MKQASGSAGYSGTPLPKKLGIRDGHTVRLVDALVGFDSMLVPFPDGVTIRRGLRGRADMTLCFCAHPRALSPAMRRSCCSPDGAGSDVNDAPRSYA